MVSRLDHSLFDLEDADAVTAETGRPCPGDRVVSFGESSAPPSALGAPEPGTLVGGYGIASAAVPWGHAGEVSWAIDERSGSPVVILWLWPELRGGRLEERLLDEAELAGAITSSRVAAPEAVVHEGGRVGIVRRCAAGETLRQRLERGEPLSIEATVRLGRQLARAIARLHAIGLVHGDVRPETVVIGLDGEVTLSVYGASLEGSPPAVVASASDVLPYGPPERSRAPHGASIDARADVWALGAVLLEALLGRPVFSEGGVAAAVAGRAPPWLVRLLERCLRRDPTERCQDVTAVLEVLVEGPAGAESIAGEEGDEPGADEETADREGAAAAGAADDGDDAVSWLSEVILGATLVVGLGIVGTALGRVIEAVLTPGG